MKVLMQNRFDMFDCGYGDRVHFLNVYEHLVKLGVDVDYALDLTPDVSQYDVVHLFNISRSDTYFQLLNAKKYKKPVVLTPINISVKLIEELTKREGLNARDKLLGFVKNSPILKDVALSIKFRHPVQRRSKALEYNTKAFLRAQKKVLQHIDYICPGSRAEAHIIQETFGILPPHRVVYVGIDDFFSNAVPDAFVSKYGLSDFVLCVGLVSPLKNQLSLIKALKNTGITVVIAGGYGKSATYNKRCQKEAKDGHVVFLGHVERELLASAYAAAKVHVLPSFSETTGRANFEAGLAGANVVVSNIPVHQEYCRDFVEYCDPAHIASIREATLRAFSKPKNAEFLKFIKKNYTWENMARDIAQVYEHLLQQKRPRPATVGVM